MTSTSFPVHYIVEKPAQFTRLQLVIRVLAVIVIGMLGTSLGALYVLAYFGLPVYAAIRLSGARDPEEYLVQDGSRVIRGLRWFAAIYGWFGLVAEALPRRSASEVVHVDIEPMGRPSAASALWRVLLGVPSAIVLAFLGCLAGLVWLLSAILVLFRQDVPRWAYSYLTGVQRWSVRLLAYQASIIDVYPPFSFADAPPPALPAARA